ncbi:hypothetical protein DACRYDRAFT_103718 [Dacryopinax primogenitus]|uniref:P-loop containing nucleoside triphosphate hydrolase protein n=1 Tax=Dacryopinax primogenitus (strain DJM 731) TaxID=1858805 RepID=M5G4P4_DACPD|nr:uncharacterized protein DACRYDRAFT_103718 [Dacryopinax primogenitus]EJU05221.1 hypothetical protein DACRYDRAFT_103718 [Dacryopinax primogenitus]
MAQWKGTETTPTHLRVIGAGLGRTGTRSMKEALEMLGFGPCHHMVSLIDDPTGKRMDMFAEAYAGKSVDWKQVMDGFGSTVDHPTTEFALELIDAFPNALVILTTRDDAEIGKGVGNWYRSNYGPMGPQSYVKHNAKMIESIPKEKLLVFNVKQGWKPLCEFLGVPVPTVPFPRMNDTAELQARIRTMRLTGVGYWILELGLLGLMVHQIIRKRLWDVSVLRQLMNM